MWTKAFWKGTAERAVRAGASAAGSALIVGDGMLNAFNVDWSEAGGIFLGGAAISTLLSLAGGAFGPGNGPSLTGAEETAERKILI